MAVYLAAPNSSSSSVPAFAERNLSSLQPAKIEDTGIHVIRNGARPIGFDTFINQIHSIAHATIKKTIEYFPKSMYRVLQECEGEAYVAPPEVVVELPGMKADAPELEAIQLKKLPDSKAGIFYGRLDYDNTKRLFVLGPTEYDVATSGQGKRGRDDMDLDADVRALKKMKVVKL